MAENECPHIDKSESTWRCGLNGIELRALARNCYNGAACQLRQERAEAETARLRERIAELEAALDMLAITTRKYRSLPRIDGDTIGRLEAELSKALEKARAVLEGDAPIVCGAHQEGAVGLPKGAS